MHTPLNTAAYFRPIFWKRVAARLIVLDVGASRGQAVPLA
jgi:hypothetical protein